MKNLDSIFYNWNLFFKLAYEHRYHWYRIIWKCYSQVGALLLTIKLHYMKTRHEYQNMKNILLEE